MKDLKVSSDRKGRYYYDPDNPEKKYRSVSTVLNWGEPKSRANDGAKIGSICHYNILRNYTDEFIDIPTETPYWMNHEDVNNLIDDALEMWRNLELDEVVKEWIAVEKAIWWEGEIDGLVCYYAGRLDAIASFIDNQIRLVDIKTGDEYEKYPLQMGGYVQAYEQMTGAYINEVWITYLDIGSNWVKEAGRVFKRNPHKVPRVVVMNRQEIDEAIKNFNQKLKKVFGVE